MIAEDGHPFAQALLQHTGRNHSSKGGLLAKARTKADWRVVSVREAAGTAPPGTTLLRLRQRISEPVESLKQARLRRQVT